MAPTRRAGSGRGSAVRGDQTKASCLINNQGGRASCTICTMKRIRESHGGNVAVTCQLLNDSGLRTSRPSSHASRR
eukprot:scaffold126207_cov27-Tisochrysis_lutea.AAC.1